jgi:hypothetical protein
VKGAFTSLPGILEESGKILRRQRVCKFHFSENFKKTGWAIVIPFFGSKGVRQGYDAGTRGE